MPDFSWVNWQLNCREFILIPAASRGAWETPHQISSNVLQMGTVEFHCIPVMGACFYPEPGKADVTCPCLPLSQPFRKSYEANFPQQYSLKEKFTACEGNMYFLIIIIIILCLPREGEEGGASLLNRERNFPVSVPRIDTQNSAILISSHPSAAGWDQLIQIFYQLVTLCTKISLCTTQLFLPLCSAKHTLNQQLPRL